MTVPLDSDIVSRIDKLIATHLRETVEAERARPAGTGKHLSLPVASLVASSAASRYKNNIKIIYSQNACFIRSKT
jgi:hypothetical protein